MNQYCPSNDLRLWSGYRRALACRTTALEQQVKALRLGTAPPRREGSDATVRRTNNPVKQAAIEPRKLRRLTSTIPYDAPEEVCLHFPYSQTGFIQSAVWRKVRFPAPQFHFLLPMAHVRDGIRVFYEGQRVFVRIGAHPSLPCCGHSFLTVLGNRFLNRLRTRIQDWQADLLTGTIRRLAW